MAEITAEQLRAARAVLGDAMEVVANATGIGVATLQRYESTSGVPKSRKGNVSTLRSYYEAAGIEFIGTPDEAPGIRIQKAPR